jgi:hypothetical protein
MKISKEIIKKVNSPKTLFIFLILLVIAILLIHFLFRGIRTMFDMDKKDVTKLDDAKIIADDDDSTTNIPNMPNMPNMPNKNSNNFSTKNNN